MCLLNPVTPSRTEGAACSRTSTNGWKVGAEGSLRLTKRVPRRGSVRGVIDLVRAVAWNILGGVVEHWV